VVTPSCLPADRCILLRVIVAVSAIDAVLALRAPLGVVARRKAQLQVGRTGPGLERDGLIGWKNAGTVALQEQGRRSRTAGWFFTHRATSGKCCPLPGI
jgi:hypothetical protein